MTEKLPPNATIYDALPTLRNSIEFVRGILGNLVAYRTGEAEPVVRIGVTGQGISPYYRIDRGGQGLAAFNGESHRAFQNIELHDSNWSTEALDIAEVQTILGQLRGAKQKG